MKNVLICRLWLVLVFLKTVSFAQSKTAIDSVIANTQYIGKGKDIIDVGGKSKLVPMQYNRKTNNNTFYTDSTAAIEIQSLYKMIKNGYDFHDIAINYSQDPGSYKSGGVLRLTTMKEYVSEFRDVILGLKVDEVSTPFRTGFGYHIAQLIAINDGVYITRHILLRVD